MTGATLFPKGLAWTLLGVNSIQVSGLITLNQRRLKVNDDNDVEKKDLRIKVATPL